MLDGRGHLQKTGFWCVNLWRRHVAFPSKIIQLFSASLPAVLSIPLSCRSRVQTRRTWHRSWSRRRRLSCWRKRRRRPRPNRSHRLGQRSCSSFLEKIVQTIKQIGDILGILKDIWKERRAKCRLHRMLLDAYNYYLCSIGPLVRFSSTLFFAETFYEDENFYIFCTVISSDMLRLHIEKQRLEVQRTGLDIREVPGCEDSTLVRSSWHLVPDLNAITRETWQVLQLAELNRLTDSLIFPTGKFRTNPPTPHPNRCFREGNKAFLCA